MRIGTTVQPKIYAAAQAPQQQQTQESPKAGSDALVDKIIDNTYLSANYAASGLTGAASGGAAFLSTGLPSAVTTTGSVLYNVARTEKIGPTLKTLALVSAVPVAAAATALAAPISLLAGIWQGVGEVESSVPRQFTVKEAAQEAYTEVRSGFKSFTGDIQKGMTELGEYKLAPGEKAVEIPLIRAGKTLIMGAIGAAVGGIAGAVSALTATASEAGKGVVKAFADENLNVGEKLFAAGTSVLSAPVHGAIYGVRTALGTLGGALGQTWDKDSITEGAKNIYRNATNSVAASVAPFSVLTQERQPAQ